MCDGRHSAAACTRRTAHTVAITVHQPVGLTRIEALGALLASGFETLFSGAWWISALPGLTLVLLILVVNLLGDWLRDTLNPRHYRG